MSVMATESPEVEVFVEDLYDRLHRHSGGRGESFIYVAEQWWEELLEPLGYERCDQSAVFKGLKILKDSRRIRSASVKGPRVHDYKRRSNYPRPRRVEITVLG